MSANPSLASSVTAESKEQSQDSHKNGKVYQRQNNNKSRKNGKHARNVIVQATNSVFLVPPCKASAFNAETAKDNNFMTYDPSVTVQVIQKEWGGLYNLLKEEMGVNVVTPQISGYDLNTPDCLFPNNWISTEQVTKNIIIYPMKAKTRRMEVREDIIDQISDYYQYDASNVLDLRDMGFKNNIFLEGTGVMVLDHINKLAYCSLSQRCHASMVLHWCNLFGYGYIVFESHLNDAIIYHTNVMMSIGSTWAVVAMDCIKGDISKKILKNAILQSGKQLIEITEKQVSSFCGNILELEIKNQNDGFTKGLVMSTRAYNAFTKEQFALFKKHKLKIFKTNVDNIESVLGGGVRCMICELFQ